MNRYAGEIPIEWFVKRDMEMLPYAIVSSLKDVDWPDNATICEYVKIRLNGIDEFYIFTPDETWEKI